MVKITKEPSRGDEFVGVGERLDVEVVGGEEAIGTEAGPHAAESDDNVAGGGGEGSEGSGKFEIRDVIEEAVAIPESRLDDVDEIEV